MMKMMKMKTLEEIWLRYSLNHDHLRIFGCVADLTRVKENWMHVLSCACFWAFSEVVKGYHLRYLESD